MSQYWIRKIARDPRCQKEGSHRVDPGYRFRDLRPQDINKAHISMISINNSYIQNGCLCHCEIVEDGNDPVWGT